MIYNQKISDRFRGYMPVVIDVETGGLVPEKDALLEIAAVTLNCNNNGIFELAETLQTHVQPFPGANISKEALEINRITPDHPFRFAVTEKEALTTIFSRLSIAKKEAGCNRCVLVGHNAWFDLSFLNAAIKRSEIKETSNPFHTFTSFDTATLGALVYGHTVLSEMLKRAQIPFDSNEHHSALYDAEQTAKLFCIMINKYKWPPYKFSNNQYEL